MAFISLIFFALSLNAAELPQFLTKHSPETLRYISMDGRFAYVTKKPGVLALVSSFKSTDFVSDTSLSSFRVKTSDSKARVVIEVIPRAHNEFNFLKNNRILVADWGNTTTREVGQGQSAKLHLADEWISYYQAYEKIIHLENLVTQKKYKIKLSPKPNSFFIPQVEMVNSSTVVYSDINPNGHSAFISFDILTQKSNIIYKSSEIGTRLELCKKNGYLAMGEFPYEGVSASSKISQGRISGSFDLSGFTTLYSSVEHDLGNMICMSDQIYFIKTLSHNKKLNHKTTEAVSINLKTQQVTAKSELKSVSQLIEMDGRILIPFRGDFFVLEGKANLGDDTLKAPVGIQEELPLEI